MELNEELNKKYQKDKETYEKVANLKQNIENLKKDLKKYNRKKEDAEKNKQRAIEDKDKNAKENAEAAIKLSETEINKIKSRIKKSEELIKSNKEKVDSYIGELSKNPEFEAHMNSILEKRYNRKIKKAVDYKQQTDLMIEICSKHPNIENNLKGMIRANEELKKLDEELKKLDPVKDKKRIDEINNVEIPTIASKRDLNKNSFKTFCEKNKLEFSEDFLKELIEEKSFAHDKDGNIKAVKSLKNISKGYEKRISAYEKSIEKIPGAKVYDSVKKQQETLKRDSEENPEKVEFNNEKDNLPAKQFKWWEFKKRFNNWKEQRNVKKEAEKIEKENQGKTEESSKKFRDAYKYDIVKDYIDSKEVEIYKEASKEIRKANKNKEEEKDNDEERE